MGVITISRGSYSKGKEIAEKLAERLEYKCISRDILLEASAHFNIPELKLVRAIHDAPSILDRFKHGKDKYVVFIREALLEHIKKDNLIYHGLAGHFLLRGIPNILKVRIIADIEDRVKEEMARRDVTEDEARSLLTRDDEERRKWSMYLYGIDTKDPSLYDIVLHIDNLSVYDAVDVLAGVAQRPCFQTTQESQTIIQNLHLAAKAQGALFDRFPSAEVESDNGVVCVRIEAMLSREEEITDIVKEILRDVEGVEDVRVNVVPIDIG